MNGRRRWTAAPANRAKRRPALALAALPLAAATLLVACRGGSDDIAVDGSSTVGPITEAMAEEFLKQADLRVSVGISGTGGGFEKLCRGEIDINNASRPIDEDDEKEGAACARRGIEYVEFKVALDGLTVVTHPGNDFAACLTISQLRAIWDAGSEVDNWAQVDASFPDLGMKLYGPGPDSGTFDYFTKAVNGTTDQSRSDYTASEDDYVLVQGVEHDAGALGYFGYAYYQGEGSGLNGVAVKRDIDKNGEPVEGAACVSPTVDSINDGTYPLARPLFLYVTRDALADADVRAFVEFYLTHPQYVTDVGFVPLPEEEYRAQLDLLHDVSPGGER